MARFEIYALGVTSITVNRSADLNSFTGRELEGLTITLNDNNYEKINLTDNDPDFDDDDRSQETRGVQTFDGQTYGNDTDIEAEYTLTLRDPGTGKEYQVLGLNLDRGQQIEGLVFVDEVPPTGVAFEVVSFDEGPGRRGVEDVPYSRLAVPCFTPGTLIETPDGPRAVEDLQVGDLVSTLDNGVQKLIWVGASAQRTLDLMRAPHLRPIEIKQHAFGDGQPNRDMLVSPQHKIMLQGWRAELLFGEDQVLVAAKHLVNDTTIRPVDEIEAVTYIHLQCEGHEVLISDGLPTESFNPGPTVVGDLPDACRVELQALFPEHDLLKQAPLIQARPVLTRREARAMVA